MSNGHSAWVEMLGGEVSYVEGNEYRTRYLHAGGGSKPPVILIHGVGGHAESYLRNVIPLAELLPERDIYAIDLVGHGFSSKTGEYGLADYGDHVAAFIEGLDHDRAHIHGESLGAMVATWIGINRPELAQSLGLNTMAIVDDDIHETVLSAEQIERMEQESADLFHRTQEMMEEGFPKSLVRRRVEWLFYGDIPEELVDIRYHIYQRPEVQSHMPEIYSERGAMESFGEGDFDQIDRPTLVVHTTHNPGTPAESMKYVHENLLDDSEYHLLEASAHWPQWEEAARFNEITARFVGANDV